MKIRPFTGGFNSGATTQGYKNPEINQDNTVTAKLKDDAAAIRLATPPKAEAGEDRAAKVADIAARVKDGSYKPSSEDVATALVRDLF